MMDEVQGSGAERGGIADALAAEFARLVAVGTLYAVLVAHPCDVRNGRHFLDDDHPCSPPYVQYHWRDECTPVGESGPGIQIEVVGDRYLRRPHSPEVVRRLRALGLTEPGVLGDDFDNWVAFRVGEATEPNSVARMLVAALSAMDVPLLPAESSVCGGVAGCEFEWITSDERFELQSVLRAMGSRFDQGTTSVP
jgi:hypothetical protein